MWDGLLFLIGLCLVMATASFLAGSLPLSFSMSQRKLRLITALGTGVLVGTSLIVIIPEGIETLYGASGKDHSHAKRSTSLASQRRQLVVPTIADLTGSDWFDDGLSTALHHVRVPRDAVGEAVEIGFPADPDTGFGTGPDDSLSITSGGPNDGSSSDAGHDEQSSVPGDSPSILPDSHTEGSFHSGEEKTSWDPRAYVGISLILGFILMYLIDNLPRQAGSFTQPQRFHVSLNQFSLNRSESTASEAAETPTADTFAPNHSRGGSRPSSTTVGLVIHAAADGIALGASSTTASSLSFIIFIALMIHKAPAAFGLTSVLLKQGLSKRAARAHLIVFSLAAPVGALVTWSAAHFLGYSSLAQDSSSAEFATGVLLLFSGGTFLYVAVHTMQESGRGHEEVQANSYHEVPLGEMYTQPSSSEKAGTGGGLTETVCSVAGMLLPLLTQFGHVH